MMKNRLLRNVVHQLSNIPLKRKLLLSYFIIIFIPLSLLTSVTNTILSKGYENQILFSATQSFDQANEYLNYKINTLINSADIVHFNNDVQSVLSNTQEFYEDNVIQQNVDFMNLSVFFSSLERNADVYRVSLYTPDWFSWSNQNYNFYNIDSFKKTEEYEKLILSTDKVMWLPPQYITEINGNRTKVITLLKKIRNKESLGDLIGIVRINALEENFKKIIAKSNSSQNGVVFLQNEEGIVICSSDETLLRKSNLDKEIPNVQNALLPAVWNIIHIGNSKFCVLSTKIKDTDWNMISVIPYTDILSQSNNILRIMLALMIFIGIVAYVSAYFISRSSTERISLLISRMKMVQSGDLDVQLVQKSDDEIGKLFESFNFMIRKIKTLISEQFAIGKEMKSSELKALQAQINPHFLYNTLDLINWKAMDINSTEIANITQALAKFYKLSLNKGKDIVTIEDEIKHVSVYIQIQNMRFDNRIKLILDVDEAIYQYGIIKIILQPIVENSILHGILENRSTEGGTIQICGFFQNNTIMISVKDDGVGMDQTTLEQMLSGNLKSKSGGYGLKNINNRLQLTYGEQYGLSVQSAVGAGTTVTLTIPITPIIQQDNPLTP